MRSITDAHHHLWTIGTGLRPWVEQRGIVRFFGDPTPIQSDYRPEQFRADWEGLLVTSSVHVQVGTAPGREVEETAWLESEAERAGLPSAIVAFADLTSPDLERTLDDHAASSPRLRGIRQIVGRHPSEDARTGSQALLADARFLAGLRSLRARGLSFDLQLTAPMLAQALRLFEQVPDLPVALCHAGSPWDRSPEGLARWRADLTQFAQLPRASVKLSGLGMFDRQWTVSSLAPIVKNALEAFGPQRTMWGSNFPVDKLYRGYRPLFEAIESLVPREWRDSVFSATARAFYRLP